MALIGRLIGKLLKRGSITIINPDGERATYGPGSGKALTISVTDRKVLFDLVRNPRLGIGEAYMGGRLTIQDGTILDLLELVTGSNRWEEGGKARKLFGKSKIGALKALWRRNPAAKSRRNVAHHYDIGNDLYRLFLDDDLQYSCAYFTDPKNSLEQAQSDKKAHIAAKLDLKPGQRVLDIGCGWGGTALYLHRVAKVDVLGIKTLGLRRGDYPRVNIDASIQLRPFLVAHAEQAGTTADLEHLEGPPDTVLEVGVTR